MLKKWAKFVGTLLAYMAVIFGIPLALLGLGILIFKFIYNV